MKLPVRGRLSRRAALIWGIVIFLWLGPEDTAVWPVVVLGTGLSGLLVILWILGRLGGKTLPLRCIVAGAGLSGAVIGAGASLAAAGLMFFKNARHAHIYLDFPPGLMLEILRRAPVWTLAGALTGLGLALARLALRREVGTRDRHPEEVAETQT